MTLRIKAVLVALAIIAVVFVQADSCTTNTAGNANTYCDHGNRIYDDESGHGLAVVARDPTCPQPGE